MYYEMRDIYWYQHITHREQCASICPGNSYPLNLADLKPPQLVLMDGDDAAAPSKEKHAHSYEVLNAVLASLIRITSAHSRIHSLTRPTIQHTTKPPNHTQMTRYMV
jgi:hypothetical protein